MDERKETIKSNSWSTAIEPELQSQTPLTLDISKDGHVAVFSSPGYGKSTFLQSVIMDVARQHSPEHLHVYLLDFGTNGLKCH